MAVLRTLLRCAALEGDKGDFLNQDTINTRVSEEWDT